MRSLNEALDCFAASSLTGVVKQALRNTRIRTISRNLGLAGLSGLLLVLSFPPFDVSILIWIALVPLLLALHQKALLESFLLSYVTGWIYFSGMSIGLWAIPSFHVIDFLLLVAILANYVGLWGFAISWLSPRTRLSMIVIPSSLWVVCEYLRSHLFFLSSPWMLLGHTQYLNSPVMQITTLTGVYGLSFLIISVNAVLALGLYVLRSRFRAGAISGGTPKPALTPLAVVCCLLMLVYVYGMFRLSFPTGGERVQVAVIQTNLSRQQKWSDSPAQLLDRYITATHALLQRSHPLLIIWPETAITTDIQHNPPILRRISALAQEAGSYLFIGSSDYGKFEDRKLKDKYYNTMHLFSPEGRLVHKYQKMILLPFGEYDPFENMVPLPKALLSESGTFVPGRQYTIFEASLMKFGAVICWEILFPDHVREFVNRGAQFMVNASEDSWFGKSISEEYLAIATFRAVENGIAVVRLSNAGVSAFIDPVGRISRSIDGFATGDSAKAMALEDEIILSNSPTFYSRYGDVFAFFQIGALVLVVALSRKPFTALSKRQRRIKANVEEL